MQNKIIKNKAAIKNKKAIKSIKITKYYYDAFTKNLLLNYLLNEINNYDKSEPAYDACNEIIKQLKGNN